MLGGQGRLDHPLASDRLTPPSVHISVHPSHPSEGLDFHLLDETATDEWDDVQPFFFGSPCITHFLVDGIVSLPGVFFHIKWHASCCVGVGVAQAEPVVSTMGWGYTGMHGEQAHGVHVGMHAHDDNVVRVRPLSPAVLQPIFPRFHYWREFTYRPMRTSIHFFVRKSGIERSKHGGSGAYSSFPLDPPSLSLA